MSPLRLFVLIVCLGVTSVPISVYGNDNDASYTRQEEIIYGRKYGMALTMDVFTPNERANGAAVIFCVSGQMFSDHRNIRPSLIHPFVDRGYTVFAVVHGSRPKFTVPEILEDMHRAVRFIRYNAARYGIDQGRIGITGLSSGGMLSLMQGVAGKVGDAEADDPVDRMTSRVQAVACFYPATDALNWGRPGTINDGLKSLRAPFDFRAYNTETRRFERVTDEDRVLDIAKKISPITHVTSDDPPCLIIHGDADRSIPIQQSEVIIDAFENVGVTAKLIVKPGAGHGWRDMEKDVVTFVSWFDTYLVRKATQR